MLRALAKYLDALNLTSSPCHAQAMGYQYSSVPVSLLRLHLRIMMERSCACRKKCFALQVRGEMRLVANWPDRIEWDLAKDNTPGIVSPPALKFCFFFS